MPDFHSKTVARVAKAVKDSLANTRPVTHIGTGQAKVERVASNRRFTDDTGRLRFDRTSASRDPKAREADGGTIDPFLKSLTLYDGEQAIVAVHAYAVHPMSFYGRGGASADFVGLARKLRQAEEPKTLQIYVSGCSGNVTAGKFNDGAVENRPELGKRILQAMRDASKASVKQPINDCTFRSEKLELPVRTGAGFSEADLKKRLADGPRPFDQCLAALGLSWRKRVIAGQPIDVPAIDFGSAALLLLPAESYVEFQLMAQAARPKDFVLTAGYGESGPGYIPIEKAWEEKDGNLSDWCWVDPGSEAKMKKAIEAVLKSAH
jgi:hypothetical protein